MINRVYASSYEGFVSQKIDIANHLHNEGWCIIEAWNSDPETLLQIASSFGNLQTHVRSNEQGIVGLGGDTLSGDWKENIDEYRGVASNDPFDMHTDASFLNGMFLVNGKMQTITSPKILFLQCVVPADSGGENVIVDHQKILLELLHTNPSLIKTLSAPGCAAFCRDDQIAYGVSVYRKLSNGNFGVRFRFDQAVYCPTWSFESMKSVHKNYHHNEKFRQYVPLRQKEILIVDNWRVLHGREKIFGMNRRFRRMWVSANPHEMLNAENRPRMHRAINHLAAYCDVPTMFTNLFVDIKFGIKLNLSNQLQMEDCIREAAILHPMYG
ncbi:MAG: TauD/TfdA family dioxygenase [Anaerolineae bacterium]|nr:TauD/TfdA family dioxygenase [Anaerolineae bacterium]